jgi:release factor glutamine methyltransferase
MEKSFTFKFASDQELVLKVREGAFTPTGTTNELVQSVHEHLNQPGKLLDLGCGIGVTGLALSKLGLVKGALCASDLSQSAVECAKKNAAKYSCDIVAKCGSVFEPWQGEKFDYIVNDISGVAKAVAEISPWFTGVPCDAGFDGVALVTQVLNEAPNYLNEGGKIFFPVISLSNIDKIIAAAQDNFKTVRMLSRAEWPLPKEMYQHAALLRELREKNDISFSEKFGMMIWSTDIYMAHN